MAGVCGGLGRHFDLDPVVFRVVLGVLAVAGGIGLIFYGFAWLLIAADGEEENEARRLLSGRVEGASLTAVLMALVGCGLFLSMLGANGQTISFAILLACGLSGAALWSQRRRLAGDREPDAAAAAHTVPEAPPETQAPPPPGGMMSWWRDPIVKDGSTGPVPVGYLWGPPDSDADQPAPAPPHRPWGAGAPPRPAQPAGPRSIGGLVLVLALLAGVIGTAAAWDGQPLAVCLQIGLASALTVFGLGLAVSSFLGRTGFGTVFMTVVTALLLAGASALPHEIGTQFTRAEWRPATVAEVQPRYELGSGSATLDLSALDIPAEGTARTAAELGAGHLEVVVPPDVTVNVHAEAGLGEVLLPGAAAQERHEGPAQDVTVSIPPPAGVIRGGTLDLHLEVAIGLVEVTRAAS
ncbi:PspC domain-containing protein [Streptomyces coeruleoprunus]